MLIFKIWTRLLTLKWIDSKPYSLSYLEYSNVHVKRNFFYLFLVFWKLQERRCSLCSFLYLSQLNREGGEEKIDTPCLFSRCRFSGFISIRLAFSTIWNCCVDNEFCGDKEHMHVCTYTRFSSSLIIAYDKVFSLLLWSTRCTDTLHGR